jgi:hypothetical protein
MKKIKYFEYDLWPLIDLVTMSIQSRGAMKSQKAQKVKKGQITK